MFSQNGSQPSGESKMNQRQTEPVRFGQFSVDLHTHEVRKDSTKLRLVGQPFAILAELLQRPGELVTREELRERLWPGDTFIDFDHGLNAAVNKLREALCDSADDPRYIETLPRRGYRFIGQIEAQTAPPATRSDASPPTAPIPQQASFANVPVLPLTSARPRSVLRWAAIFTAFLIVGLAVFSSVSSRRKMLAAVPLPARITEFTQPDVSAGEPAFSADGQYLAYYRDGGISGSSGIFVQTVGTAASRQLTSSERDCCAAWSPDGRTLAFARYSSNTEIGLFLVPAEGGAERRLEIPGAAPKMGRIDWSPDGKTIAYSGGTGLSLFALQDSSARQLTAPPPLTQDWGPSFSPDGKFILFARSSEMGFPEQILRISVAGGEPTLISTEVARLRGSPRWSADGRSVIFASDRGGKPALWRVSTESKEAAVQFNDGGSHPTISRQGQRMAYQRETRSLTVWEMSLAEGGKSEVRALVPLTSQTDQGPGPQYSRDGKKIAYMSDRGGTMEIWVSDRDGGNAKQLTAIGDAGTPRWSPDGQSIVFDASRRRGSGIYSVSVNGGAPHLLTPDDFENRCPSWSQDGKWIYFASSRTNKWQVWKVPSEGGAAIQVTAHGGHAPLESADGKYIYYAKTPHANPQIWQIAKNGGAEALVSPLVRPPSWASWTVVDHGILFAESPGEGAPVVNFFDTASHRIKTLGGLNVAPFWLTATRDGKSVAFDRPGWQESQIMLVENFR